MAEFRTMARAVMTTCGLTNARLRKNQKCIEILSGPRKSDRDRDGGIPGRAAASGNEDHELIPLSAHRCRPGNHGHVRILGVESGIKEMNRNCAAYRRAGTRSDEEVPEIAPQARPRRERRSVYLPAFENTLKNLNVCGVECAVLIQVSGRHA